MPKEYFGCSNRIYNEVSGLFFGLAFGMGGIGAAVLGEPATGQASSLFIVFAPSSL
jgi:hypothetical protein